MTNANLTSPVGQYKPELLLLAPESGEDQDTLSLVSQFLELGVPIELDENWRLPTVPPKDLSAYKACLFPESARDKYDSDLDVFRKNGGFLGYFKYYPINSKVVFPMPNQNASHGPTYQYFHKFGRDVYFFDMASTLLEGDLSVNDPDFARVLKSRSVDSLIAEYRKSYFKRYFKGKYDRDPWGGWSDRAYTTLMNAFLLSERLEDEEWKDLVNYCISKVCEASDEAAKGTFEDFKALKPKTCLNAATFAELIMEHGQKTNQSHVMDAGINLIKNYVEHATIIDGVITPEFSRFLWADATLIVAPSLCWAYQLTKDKKYLSLADAMIRKIAERNHRPDGIWWHWSNTKGKKGACWNSAAGWVLLYLMRSLKALDPASSSADFIRKELVKTYDGLVKFQDPEKGIWHLVIDEPETRIETRGSALILYCYDRLKEMNVLSSKYDDVMDQAFEGLKRLNYHAGMAATCRGTATGTADYYRTRPMGWFDGSLFPATMVVRREKVEPKLQLQKVGR